MYPWVAISRTAREDSRARGPKARAACNIRERKPFIHARRAPVARTKNAPVPEVGAEAPEFNLPSAQGGQLRLSMRTAFGPVVVVFFRGAWSEHYVANYKAPSEKEDEIN